MASISIPNIFAAGNKIVAAQVNSNFTTFKTFIEGQCVQIDGSTKATTSSLTDLCVTAAKLGDQSVTTSKIADSAVTAVKIADATITAAKFANTLRPVYFNTSTTGLPTTEGTIAYINSNTATEGIQTYVNGIWLKPWNMPWGVVGYAQAVTNQTGIGTSATDLTNLSITANFVAFRYYRLSAYVPIVVGATATYAIVQITDYYNSQMALHRQNLDGALLENKFMPSTIFKPTVSNEIPFKVRAYANAGTINVNASSSNIAFLLIEDLGPFSGHN